MTFDVNNERVFYEVLEFSGFLSMGEKLFAYPMRSFKHSGDNMDKLVLNVDKDKLKAAPGFARDIWPNWLTYGGEVDRHYAETVKLKERPNQILCRASESIGKNANDRAGKAMGEIDEIVVEMNNAKIQYAVLEVNLSWNLKDKLIALPMRAFTYPADKDDLILNVDKAAIDTTRAFDNNRWPNLNDPNCVIGIDRYLSAVSRTAPSGQAEARLSVKAKYGSGNS